MTPNRSRARPIELLDRVESKDGSNLRLVVLALHPFARRCLPQPRRASWCQGVRGFGVHWPRSLLRLQHSRGVREGWRYILTSPLTSLDPPRLWICMPLLPLDVWCRSDRILGLRFKTCVLESLVFLSPWFPPFIWGSHTLDCLSFGAGLASTKDCMFLGGRMIIFRLTFLKFFLLSS